MKVVATKLGFYNNVRVRDGEVFEVKEKLFSKNWMEPVSEDEKKPSKKLAQKVPEKVESSPSNSDVI